MVRSHTLLHLCFRLTTIGYRSIVICGEISMIFKDIGGPSSLVEKYSFLVFMRKGDQKYECALMYMFHIFIFTDKL